MEINKIFHALTQLPNKLPMLDELADWLQPIIHRIYRGGNSMAKGIENFLNGVWLGHPFHPVITDIPIGAWTAAVTLDVLEANTGSSAIGKGADAAIALGSVAAVGAAASGLTDWQHLSGEPRRIGVLHALLNTAVLGLFTASLVARGARNRPLGRSLALGGYGILFLSAFYGGDLVYRLKIGTKHSRAQEKPDGYIPVMAEAELLEGRMARVMVDDTPVLLVRRGEQVFAIAETCSHLGGPLAEGELRDDNSVVCPWHGSRYDLATGEVIDGPSAYNQACYQARIFNNRVEIRQSG